MSKLRVLDLFSGIGGFSLGLERTGGFETVAFCEIEPFPRKVLAKHWPNVPCYEDVRTLTAERLAADGISVDTICGGFPCQDVSGAGLRAGIEAERSGLWSEYSRLIGELRPRIVIVENVADLCLRGLDKVLGDLAAVGYDAEWHCIPAAAVGADHLRDRIWIIAYPNSQGCQQVDERRRIVSEEEVGEGDICGTVSECLGRFFARGIDFSGFYNTHKPVLDRGAHGVPGRLDRHHGLGNAVVPQIPELIGRAILEAESRFSIEVRG